MRETERYEITNADHGAIRIDHSSAHLPHKFICIHPGADPWSAFSHGVIQQQQRELAALQQVISDQIKVIDDLEHRRVKVCDENDQLRAELAAAVAERDRLRGKLDEIAKDHIGERSTRLLYAAHSERDGLLQQLRDFTECAMKIIPADWRPGYAWTDDCVMNVLAEYVIELRTRAEQAEARLAAIDAAPTVAWKLIESAPNDVRIVLAYFGHDKSWDGIAAVGYFFRWDSMPTRIAAGWPVRGCDPSHWMPLPDTPLGTELIARPAKD